MPQTVEDVANQGISARLSLAYQDDRLSVSPSDVNMKIFKTQGAVPAIEYWLANPSAAEHEGEKIKPYKIVQEETRASVMQAVQNLLGSDSQEQDLGILVTHTGKIEPVIFALINSARAHPIEKVSDIGGLIDMAEFARLTIGKSNGVYTAKVNVKGHDYNVDLNNI